MDIRQAADSDIDRLFELWKEIQLYSLTRFSDFIKFTIVRNYNYKLYTLNCSK